MYKFTTKAYSKIHAIKQEIITSYLTCYLMLQNFTGEMERKFFMNFHVCELVSLKLRPVICRTKAHYNFHFPMKKIITFVRKRKKVNLLAASCLFRKVHLLINLAFAQLYFSDFIYTTLERFPQLLKTFPCNIFLHARED